jgi:hypothetical protein
MWLYSAMMHMLWCNAEMQFQVVMDTVTLAQGYNHTCELMIMKWCTWYGAMQKCNDTMPSDFSGWSKNARYQQQYRDDLIKQ